MASPHELSSQRNLSHWLWHPQTGVAGDGVRREKPTQVQGLPMYLR